MRIPSSPPELSAVEYDVWRAQVDLRHELTVRRGVSDVAQSQQMADGNQRFEAAAFALENLVFCADTFEALLLLEPVVEGESVFEQILLTDKDPSPVVPSQEFHPLNTLSGKDFRKQGSGFVMYAAMLPSADFESPQVETLIDLYGEQETLTLVNSMVWKLRSYNVEYSWEAVRQWATNRQKTPLRDYLAEETGALRAVRRPVRNFQYQYLNRTAQKRRRAQR